MTLDVRKELLARGDRQCALPPDARQLDRPPRDQCTRHADRAEDDLLPVRRVVAAVAVVGVAVREATARIASESFIEERGEEERTCTAGSCCTVWTRGR